MSVDVDTERVIESAVPGATVYLAVALLFAASAFVAAEWVIRPEHASRPNRAGVICLVIGILWPMIFLGLVELMALITIRKLCSVVTRPMPNDGGQSAPATAGGIEISAAEQTSLRLQVASN
jgi:hypothetical protein